MSLLQLDGVSKRFTRRDGSSVRAVNEVSLTVAAGETLSVIGESGSGKSTLARLALGLLDCDTGSVEFDGARLDQMGARARRSVRARFSAVFQEPFESLDPRMRVGAIVGEPLVIHQRSASRADRHASVTTALEQVGLAGSFVGKYPGELSGGQQQRVSLARAIVTRPQLVVLDEPTSSLDLSVQAQVLRLLVDLRESLGMAYLFITHDMAVAEHLSHRIAVMYRGDMVEVGRTSTVLHRPAHPYTLGLLASTLSADPRQRTAGVTVPAATETGEADDGCGYYARCPFRSDPRCADERPGLREIAPQHWAATRCDTEVARVLAGASVMQRPR